MMKLPGLFLAATALATAAFAQSGTTKKVGAKTPATPVAAKQPASATIDKGTVAGRTYANRSLGFEVTFPDTWLIPGDDFEAEMKKAGFDLSLKAPAAVPIADRAKINRALKQVTVAVTAYRSLPGSDENAIVRISLESLAAIPQIKDAVDYFDAMRNQFKTITLPKDFQYSETQAEQLGSRQFAFLDSSSKAGKKRLYATVRRGYAILFSLSYTREEDLQALRQMLTQGNFNLR
jgi:hypothetical protein